MGFSRQEYWSGLLFPSPGDLPDPRDQTLITYISCIGRGVLYQGSNPGLLHCRQILYIWAPQGSVDPLPRCTAKVHVCARWYLFLFYVGSCFCSNSRIIPRLVAQKWETCNTLLLKTQPWAHCLCLLLPLHLTLANSASSEKLLWPQMTGLLEAFHRKMFNEVTRSMAFLLLCKDRLPVVPQSRWKIFLPEGLWNPSLAIVEKKKSKTENLTCW